MLAQMRYKYLPAAKVQRTFVITKYISTLLNYPIAPQLLEAKYLTKNESISDMELVAGNANVSSLDLKKN